MSNLEREFAMQVRALQLPEPKREYRAIPKRRFRFDFAWPDRRLAVEVQGGIWMRTGSGRSAGHANPQRMRRDYEKHNLATLHGWRVLYFTPGMVRGGTAITTLQQVMCREVSDGERGS